MKLPIAAVMAGTLSLVLAFAPATRAQMPETSTSSDSSAAVSEEAARLRTVIERHLERPYVWGSTGLKSFDCSGFVWRVMHENGVLIKRTTARKYYMCLPRVTASDRWNFGNIVFFSDLEHCGIVDTKETFYHAAVTKGTHLSRFEPCWRRKVSGVRAMPKLRDPDAGRD